jgi:hypothetical protein
MGTFKLTAWNIEHADKLIDGLESEDAQERQRSERRRDAIRDELHALDCDILLVSEGPNGEERARGFFASVASDFDLIVRGSSDRRDYGMQGSDATTGRQWLWFLVKKDLPINASLLHLDQWRQITENNSAGEHANGKWDVSVPKSLDGQVLFEINKNHSHWRHPQVLQVNVDGAFFEIIGCHLKSKFTRKSIQGNPSDDDFFAENPDLVADIIKSRIKISTECADIRHYIDHRFEEDASAPIIVAGDLNDGPGKERIERRFLYHDLMSSLQGEIFFAQRFLNHALFDAEEDQRWSVFFRDRLDPGRDPKILLDHILFSQTFTENPQIDLFPFMAMKQGGLVEHEVHHAITGSQPSFAMTSDHKPVSMRFARREPRVG